MNAFISPETIPFLPLPNANVYPLPQEASNTNKTMNTPATVPAIKLPKRLIATETVSSNFDTYSKRIIGEFKFSPLGAITLGEYINGVQGDLKLSAGGLQARNINGDIALLFDVLTGNAYFKGTIQAGSVISEGQIDGGSININSRFQVNEEGDVTLGTDTPAMGDVAASLLLYNNEGDIVGQIQGDVAVAKYLRFNSCALGDTVFYEDGVNLQGEIARINVDDGLIMANNKPITISGTGEVAAPSNNQARLFVDQSGGKDRLMVRFNSGVSQQLAIEP